MSEPKTLLEMAGADLTPSKLENAALVLIDIQNEYLEGPVGLPDARPAIAKTAKLLAAARAAGTPVIHVAHKGGAGCLFDRDAERGQIVSELTPQDGETVVEKGLPNAFAGTNLKDLLTDTGRKEVIIAGFMTHMCVSSTARVAMDEGYRVTVDADACATRSLPDGQGGAIDPQTLHNVALAELSDRFAIIARGHEW